MSVVAKRTIRLLTKALRAEITANASRGFYGAGLSAEGYAGGYLTALGDVLLVLDKIPPGGRYGSEWAEAMKEALRPKRNPAPKATEATPQP